MYYIGLMAFPLFVFFRALSFVVGMHKKLIFVSVLPVQVFPDITKL
jgi:hypothetical protein